MSISYPPLGENDAVAKFGAPYLSHIACPSGCMVTINRPQNPRVVANGDDNVFESVLAIDMAYAAEKM